MAAVHHVGAVAPGLVTPKNDNGPLQRARVGGQRAGFGSPDFLSPRCELQALADLPADEFAALQGRFERAGLHLYELHDGSLMATGPGTTKLLHGIGCARAFLSMNGGAL